MSLDLATRLGWRGAAGLILVAAAVVAVVVIITGEGGPDTRTLDTRLGRVEVTSDRALVSEPHPLTPADVTEFTPESPQRAALTLVQAAQWGDLPRVFDAYSPAVVDRLGVARISASYAYLRSSLVGVLPRVVNVERDGNRASVTVDLLSTAGPPHRVALELQRRGGSWRVAYDTLLEFGARRYAEYRQAKDRNPLEPGAGAIEAGRRQARAYRRLAMLLDPIKAAQP